MNNDSITPVAWSGYEHLHPQDQPHSGIGGLCEGQKLWQNFNNERAIRSLHKWQQQQKDGSHCLSQDFDRIQALPTDR